MNLIQLVRKNIYEITTNGEEMTRGIEQIILIMLMQIHDILGLNENNDLVKIDIMYQQHQNGFDF
jgi:hypothetical protein